jgi:hypothetical protein
MNIFIIIHFLYLGQKNLEKSGANGDPLAPNLFLCLIIQSLFFIYYGIFS